MKNWTKCLMAALLAWPVGLALAQTKPTAGTAKPTPLIHPGGASTSPNPGLTQNNSNLHLVNVRLRQQMRQVRMDTRTGKITKEQAKAYWEKFKAIRVQELQFFRQNGQKEITANQKSQLNAILDQNNGI